MDHPTVAVISEALGPIDGIVGFPFFARYKMTVDYQKKELTLVPTDYVPGDYLQGLMAKMMAAQNPDTGPKVVAPAALWGLTVDKDAADEDAGVTVKDVVAGGPAAEAGLKAGDRLLTIDGRWTDSVADTFAAAGTIKPGRAVVVVVTRAGKKVVVKVTPANGV